MAFVLSDRVADTSTTTGTGTLTLANSAPTGYRTFGSVCSTGDRVPYAIVGRGTPREIQILDRLALLRGLAYQAADDLKDVISLEEDSGKTVGRDEALGRPNLVVAEGLSAALRRFRRLSDIGDRVQAALPGPPERWMMLEMLKVPIPVSLMDADPTMLSAAI